MLLPNGFSMHKGLFSNFSCLEIEKAVKWTQSPIKMFGKEILQPRLTSWMGTKEYTYSGILHASAYVPPVIEVLRNNLEVLLGAKFNSVLGNLYRDGQDSVSWHADDEKELGNTPVIASVSYGASRVFALRHNASRQRWDVTLNHGDLLVMSGRSQLDFQHSIPKTKQVIGQRINLTFRQVYSV